jgi:hypothetical protein
MNRGDREHVTECKLDEMRALLTTTDKRIKVYRSDKVRKKNGVPKVEHEKQPGVTAEMKCLWDHLNDNVSTPQNRSNYYAMLTDTTTQKSIRLDMVSDYTLLYTEENSNQIVLVDDDEEDDVEVKVAEVIVKQGSESGYNRTVIYTDSCLRLAEGVHISGISKSKVEKEMKILIFCLLIVTGWGFYAEESQTTEVSAHGLTVSVKQYGNEKMFDTKTEFKLTESRPPEATQSEWSAKSAQKTDQSATEGRTVRQILTRSASKEAARAASVAKQANGAELTMKLRSAAKQHAESSKANEAPNAG